MIVSPSRTLLAMNNSEEIPPVNVTITNEEDPEEVLF